MAAKQELPYWWKLSNTKWPQNTIIINFKSDVYIKLGLLWLLHLATCYFYRLSKLPQSSSWEEWRVYKWYVCETVKLLF